jgi:hypothetical protein
MKRVLALVAALAFAVSVSFAQAPDPAAPTVKSSSYVSKIFEPWLKKDSFEIKWIPGDGQSKVKTYEVHPGDGAKGYTYMSGWSDICGRGKVETLFTIEADGALSMQFVWPTPMCPTFKYVVSPQSGVGKTYGQNANGNWVMGVSSVQLLGYDASDYQKALAADEPKK